MLRLVIVEATKINLSSLTRETLLARQEVSLTTANTMLWMANHYKSIGSVEGMKYCAKRGIEAVKEYQRVTDYINSDATAIIEIA